MLVANATNVQGAAGKLSQQLRDRGFTVDDPTNAAGYEELLDTSKIYFAPTAEPVARSISMLMGDVPLVPMPVPAPIVDADVGLGNAGVLVMLGEILPARPSHRPATSDSRGVPSGGALSRASRSRRRPG